MARSKKNDAVLLGFEDEFITEKHQSILGYWSNKVGGFPNWPLEGISSPECQLCGLKQLLIVQVYAPLENSSFHRTLYVFSCINPNCWNHNESWVCLRSQLLDPEVSVPSTESIGLDWCSGEDDWDDDNGNVNITDQNSSGNDSDDDSCSLSSVIGNLNVNECNANWEFEKNSGAVGKQMSPMATAEIEKEENEVVSIDTPTKPQKDLLALLQESIPVPYYMRAGERNQNNALSFVSFFVSVGEESKVNNHSDHVRELIQEYQRNHGDILCQGLNQIRENENSSEEYEKAVPAHGDKMFHDFLCKIQNNPGQILRYSRECESPLLISPLQEYPVKCDYCSSNLVFEMQLLPTLIPKLKFPDEDCARVEYGTVLIFTCKKSCWALGDKFKKEKVIVQREVT